MMSCIYETFNIDYRKLVVYDEWSQLLIHVALDNMVILDEIRTYTHMAAEKTFQFVD